jgi:hypothetical protein
LPLGFFTITRLETQSVGVTTGFITPSFSSLCSSFFNFGSSAIGIRLNVDFTGGIDSNYVQSVYNEVIWNMHIATEESKNT